MEFCRNNCFALWKLCYNQVMLSHYLTVFVFRKKNIIFGWCLSAIYIYKNIYAIFNHMVNHVLLKEEYQQRPSRHLLSKQRIVYKRYPMGYFTNTVPISLSNKDVRLQTAIQQEHSLIARFMGPTWSRSGADGTQVGPMLAPLTLLSGLVSCIYCNGIPCFYHIVVVPHTRHSHWQISQKGSIFQCDALKYTAI